MRFGLRFIPGTCRLNYSLHLHQANQRRDFSCVRFLIFPNLEYKRVRSLASTAPGDASGCRSPFYLRYPVELSDWASGSVI
jgi:hypothetical protein